MRHTSSLMLVSALALGIAACGDASDVDAPVVPEEQAETTLTLNPIQQANFERFNRGAAQEEYARIHQELAGVSDVAGQSEDNAGAGEPGATATPADGLRSRDEMEFQWLDRNDDDRLSVAEYAIWKMAPDPSEGSGDADVLTTLTDEQIEEVGRSFFYYDSDGDTMLSQAEFALASGRPMPEETPEETFEES